MNGHPRQITVSLAISKRFTVEHMEELYSGIRLACDIYGVDLVGGDTTSSRSGLIISVTAIGDAPAGNIAYRSGAKDTDLICVSGDLGAAYMGLQLLEREKVASAGQKDFVPQFSGKEYLIERQLKPEARRDVIENLAKEELDPVNAAMNGGEDYELLFTVPLHAHEAIRKIPGVHVIGHITKPSIGAALITRDGAEIPIRAQGWNHMTPD